MTTDDRIKNIMTASMSDFYTSRAAARALIIDDDDDGNAGGAPQIHDIDERLIEGNDEHPNDANTYNGPFGDDDVGPRTFLARRRGAPAASANDGSDDQPSSLVFDISRPDGNKHITAASATSSNTPLGHIDMTSPDSPRPGRHIVALGTFFEWETESNTLDDGPSHDEERDYHYNAAFEKDRTRKSFNDLKAFYAVSRTRNAGMASAQHVGLQHLSQGGRQDVPIGDVRLDVRRGRERTEENVPTRRLPEIIHAPEEMGSAVPDASEGEVSPTHWGLRQAEEQARRVPDQGPARPLPDQLPNDSHRIADGALRRADDRNEQGVRTSHR